MLPLLVARSLRTLVRPRAPVTALARQPHRHPVSIVCNDMTYRLGALVLCVAVLVSAAYADMQYQYDDDEIEEVNSRLERCLQRLPEVTIGEPFDPDVTVESKSPESIKEPLMRKLRKFHQVPVNRLRPNSLRVSPGDICHVQAMDYLWDDGSIEGIVPVVLECLYDYYKDAALQVDEVPHGLRAREIQESLHCVTNEL